MRTDSLRLRRCRLLRRLTHPHPTGRPSARSCEGNCPVNSLVTLLPFIVLIGAMILMTRSAKKKQQQAVDMRNQMQPGSGVRTIGGMYATVKEVNEDTVLVDAGPGVELLFAKNSIGAVLSDDEYNRIVHGIEHDLKADADTVPDDASSLTETEATVDAAPSDEKSVDLGKKDAAEEPAEAKRDEEPKKTDGDADAK
ncbi:preprotein translocase subunit YajC [Streptomyces chromofuscus]|uniref:Preprotein translocase subunit YajC n=2 Tax=Streptomyces chromofuscus TaxID=42881 RepID=A0A7M2TCD8_STRCW|nr:preprotein translocase subunit YajC [Streptomyces chromofuscus]